MYPNTQLYIGGRWRDASDGGVLAVLNPATGETIGHTAHATIADRDEALDCAGRAFKVWRAVSALDRSKILLKSGDHGVFRDHRRDLSAIA